MNGHAARLSFRHDRARVSARGATAAARRVLRASLATGGADTSALMGHLQRSLDEGDIAGALLLVSSEYRLSMCRALWPIVPEAEQQTVLADAITSGDNPAREWLWLQDTLADLSACGRRLFDGDAARQMFTDLPESVTVYRGTVKTEHRRKQYGVSWTLSRDEAVWFATQHGRFRNTRSAAVVLSATLPKDALAGLLLDRGEREALLWLGSLGDVTEEAP